MRPPQSPELLDFVWLALRVVRKRRTRLHPNRMIPLALEDKSGWERLHGTAMMSGAVDVDPQDTVTTLSSVGTHARLTWTGAVYAADKPSSALIQSGGAKWTCFATTMNAVCIMISVAHWYLETLLL